MKILPFLVLFLTLAACRVGPPYTIPCSNIPDSWKGDTASQGAPFQCFWWEVFEDPYLDCLEKEAIAYNQELELAIQRVREARALAYVANAALFPDITFDPSYTTQHILTRGFGTAPPFRSKQIQYTLPIDAIYEVDLWGLLRDNRDAAIANAQAAEDAMHTVLLTLTTDLAAAYFQCRSSDRDIEILEKTIQTRRDEIDINQARYEAGLANYIDISQAQVELSNALAQLHGVQADRAIQENAIAILTGRPASEFSLTINPLDQPPPLIPPGVPSTVLCQRPDVAEAERIMAAQNALVGAAWASFFPSITLTGAEGYSSPLLKLLLTSPARYFSFATNISQVLFDGGALVGNLEAAKAVYCEAVANYQQTILVAFQEVENALSNLKEQSLQSAYLDESIAAASITTELSRERYLQGLVNYLEVVTSERTLLLTQRSAVAVMAQRYLNTLSLIKAIGGAWDVTDDTTCNLCPSE